MKTNWVLMATILFFCISCAQKRGAYEPPQPPPAEEETIEETETARDVTLEEPDEQRSGRGFDQMTVDELNRIGLLKDIHFEFDRYNLLPEARQILRQNAKLLLRSPSLKIILEGHCDERGTNEYNLALGDRRANSAKDYLQLLGIPSSQIQRTVSYGEEFPIDPRHNEEAWAKNRRVHFLIVEK